MTAPLWCRRLLVDDRGQDLIEYALLAGFISLAATAAITLIGTSLNSLYTTIDNQVTSAGS